MCACVELNRLQTEFFKMDNGIRQGDVLAPTMFITYVDTLIQELNSQNLGIQFGPEHINALMYADDMCLIAETESDLQAMIDTVSAWSRKWRLKVNVSKTCIIHFRPQNTTRTSVQFHYNGDPIEIVAQARYLGLTLTEHLDYTIMANALAESSSRALGALISKLFRAKGMHFKTYEHLFKCTVQPVMEYAAEIWGYKQYGKMETVLLRAIKTFMGVGKTCPTPVVLGDSGWMPAQLSRKLKMMTWWNKLQMMDRSRLTRRIFEHDITLAAKGKNTWSSDIKRIMRECQMEDQFHLQDEPINLCTIEQRLREEFKVIWLREIASMTKLTTYANIKENCDCEEYITARYLSYKQRAMLTSARAGILPIEVERGRWRNIPRERRICKQCDSGHVETLNHFMLECVYNLCERKDLSQYIYEKTNMNFEDMLLTVESKLNIMLNDSRICKAVAIYIINCLTKNRK